VIFISGNMEQKIYRNKLQRLLTREGRLKWRPREEFNEAQYVVM
jgi:hypothetical protein